VSAAFVLAGTRIEVWRTERLGRVSLRHAVFDFDGTISLIREGWQSVMTPMMVELLGATPRAEEKPRLERLVRDFIDESTGRMTILQMEWLAGAVSARGGAARTAADYKQEYLRRLGAHIAARITGLQQGYTSPDSLLVPGSREVLAALGSRGVVLHCASGTDTPDVRREAELLGVAASFAGGIHGADGASRSCSKKQVIQRIFSEHGLSGPELMVVGDGYVEIEEGRAAGAVCLGVATDEAAPGRVDERKRERLVAAGADVIVPDFREAQILVDYLFG